jgi:hypothetical protein
LPGQKNKIPSSVQKWVEINSVPLSHFSTLSCYGTSEPWDTGETWCYAIFCPEGLHEELSDYQDCLDKIGQQLNTIRNYPDDKRPLGTVWILPASDLQNVKHILVRQFLTVCWSLSLG